MSVHDAGRRDVAAELLLARAAGERFTARVRTLFLGAIFVVELLKDALQQTAGSGRPITLGFMVIGAAYAVGVEFLVRRRYATTLSYLTTGLDVALLTAYIAVFDANAGWGTATKLPVVYLYFALIALAGMRLLSGLALFAGLISGFALTLLLILTAVLVPERITSLGTFDDVSIPMVSPLRVVTGAIFMVIVGALTAALIQRALRVITGLQTLTFLFADLRNYTAFVERYGDRSAAQLLDDYRTLVRREVERTGGGEVKTEGDSFYVVFSTARQALDCAVAILKAAEARPRPISVGIGVHSGESIHENGQYVGSAVNLAARLGQQAGAGELLTSDVVRGLLRTSGRPAMSERSDVPLKGISDAPRIYTVMWRDFAPEPSSLS